MIKWNTTKPPQSESKPILAQFDFSTEEIDTVLCVIDKNGDVINLTSGGGTGWDSTCIGRWISLSEILDMLNGGNFVRDPVRWFAEQMEKKLQKNDHKGGWDEHALFSLLGLCRVELDELSTAINMFGRAAIFTSKRERLRKEIIRECADVANFAMMIADNARLSRKENQ